MKKFITVLTAAVAVFMLAGCSSASPYDYGTNWLIRENDVPQYYSEFDLFYIGKAPAGYGDTHDIQFNWSFSINHNMTGHKRLKMAHHNLFYVKMYSFFCLFFVLFFFFEVTD